MPSAMGSVSDSPQALQPSDLDAGGEEREDGNGEAGREGPDPVLEVLGQPGAGVRPAGGLGADHRDREAQQHPGDGGVHAGLVHEHPGDRGQREQQPPGADPLLHQQREECQRHQGAEQRQQVEVGGVEDRDDRDRDEVVDDGQRQQEGAHAAGQVGADDGQHRQREGDVGRGGDRPALEGAVGAEGDQHVDQRRHGHAAGGGQDRQRGALGVAQVAGHELALELEPDDEEEDREQPVGGPGPEAEVEVEGGRTDREVAQRLVGAAGGGVDPDQRHHGAEQQQRAADGLLPEHLGDARGLGPGAASQERTARVVLFTGHEGGTSRGRRIRCRPDFPAHRGQSSHRWAASTPIGEADLISSRSSIDPGRFAQKRWQSPHFHGACGASRGWWGAPGGR